GEHAVVYGQPALALPLPQLRAEAEIIAHTGPCRLEAPDLDLNLSVGQESDHPLVTTVLSALGHFEQPVPEVLFRIRSEIPIGRGLGSGTAISAAIFRAVKAYYGMVSDRTEEESFIQQIETLYHGRPSGIDAAVISYEKALRFERGHKALPLELPGGWSLLIADSGESTPTHVMVNDLHERHAAAPHRYDLLFTAVGALCRKAEVALKTGSYRILGRLMNQNHLLLQEMGISTPRLDELVGCAREAGALGAKLSGGGGGGVVIALCPEQSDRSAEILAAWQAAGVTRSYQIHF
ncbi:MAG TPA: mevalonate kinase, partial [Candidatus Obscuribacterales bacterium]